MKIAILAEIEESHRAVPDEGTRKFATYIAQELKKNYQVLFIKNMKQNLWQKVLLDSDIHLRLKEFQPDILFLFPTNLQSLFRFHLKYHILKFIRINSKIVLFNFQPMHHNRIMGALLKFGLPDFIFTQSTKESGHFRKLGVKSCPIPSGVDTDKFIPTSIEQKADIKKKYDIGSDRFVISHVGHLSPNRNVEILAYLKRELPQSEVILVVPPSGNVTYEIEKYLKASDVIILQKHIDNIEEIYQMSDCYIFPVVERSGAVGFPLSVIEAMACNLPVVSMRFEALPYFLKDGNGVYFVSSDAEMVSKVKEISRNCIANDNCLQAMKFSWVRVSKKIMSIVTEGYFS